MARLRLIKTILGPAKIARVYRDAEWNEFVVKLLGSTPEQWHHTDDRDEALATARMMAEVPAE